MKITPVEAERIIKHLLSDRHVSECAYDLKIIDYSSGDVVTVKDVLDALKTTYAKDF